MYWMKMSGISLRLGQNGEDSDKKVRWNVFPWGEARPNSDQLFARRLCARLKFARANSQRTSNSTQRARTARIGHSHRHGGYLLQ